MDCLVLPCYVMKKRHCQSGRYHPLNKSGLGESLVTVVVGKEKRVFFVDPFVLEENPFRVLIEKGGEEEDGDDDDDENYNGEIWKKGTEKRRRRRRVIFADVDAILFEHLLWLMYNDCSSLFKLNVEEILDFYSQDF